MSQLNKILKKFDKITTWKSDHDLALGMLRFDFPPPKNEAYLFQLDEEEEGRVFHTRGMRFNINILFFDEEGNLVYMKKNVEPGRNIICSWPSKYIVEYPSNE